MNKRVLSFVALTLVLGGALVLITLSPSTGAQTGLRNLDFNRESGTLTLRADSVSLVAILNQLKEKHGIEVVVPNLIDQKVKANLTNVALPEALKQILPYGTRFHLIVRDAELRLPANTGHKKPGHVQPKPGNVPTKDKTRPLPDALRTRIKVEPEKVKKTQTTGERGTKMKPTERVDEGKGPKQSLPPRAETKRYVRLNLSITRDGKVKIIRFLEVTGKLVLPTMISGELVYAAFVGGQVVAVGSVQDPLGVRSYQKDEYGHSAEQQDTGTFLISLPERFLNRSVLSRAVIGFYYLDEAAPRTIPLTPENFSKLRQYLKPTAEIRGKELLEAVNKRYEGRQGR
ncbi:MAG: hypothetical protein M3Q91_16950 [Acidobacteriota bacterium]|nr:hypothetical protein [Acidobacteriota bacterium]